MGSKYAIILAVAIMLLVQVQQSMQLKFNHPLHEVVDSINRRGSYLGLALAFPAEGNPLHASGLFIPTQNHPIVEIAGRKFNVGTIKGVKVIYVVTGEKGVNAAIGIHTLLQNFNIKGLVYYGMAGCANISMSVGDVGIPYQFAFTSSWRWLEFGATDTDEKQLDFGAYNLPRPGKNLLEKLLPEPVELLSDGKEVREQYWFPVDPHWYKLASQLQGVKLDRCVNATTCLPYQPQVVYGVRGSTSDIFMSNLEYAKFLIKEHGVSTVDEESAAVVHASLTNGVPVIVFRGISDVAGKQHISVAGISALAATNSFKVAMKFIDLLIKKKATYTI